MLTKEIILKVAPNAKDVDKLLLAIQEYCPKYLINTKQRMAMFIAQICHESGGFTALSENLNYSAKGLRNTWPKRFPTDAVAKEYERNPRKIANKVYSDRMGNGNEASGDGWNYRGRGTKQLTGRDNYTAFQKDTGIQVVANPDILLSYPEALISACWFWDKNKLNTYADKGDVKGATKVINGGDLGLAERQRLYDTLITLIK